MRLHLITVSHKVPKWLQEGYEDYAKRMPSSCQINLIEIPAEKRSASGEIPKIKEREAKKILSFIKPDFYVIALDVKGESWSTEKLAKEISEWQMSGKEIALIIGGPDGLADPCLNRANAKWSLSALTFPHTIVRLILAEQLYRAMTILQNHPYHRG